MTSTTFLSRLIGLYCLFLGLSMLAHKQLSVDLVSALIASPVTMYVVAIMLVPAGLAMVLKHNVWTGGALPIIVTIIGWLSLVKGLLLLFLPTQAAMGAYVTTLHYEQFFYLYAVGTLVIGLYLTYAGFRTTANVS